MHMKKERRLISIRSVVVTATVFAATFFFAATPVFSAAEPPATPPPDQTFGSRLSAPGSEEISAFSADIEILADGRIAVTEVIDYYFPSPRHGIYRDLPLSYRDEKGNSWRIPLEVSAVTDENGRALPYEVQRTSAAMRLKIGDPDETVTGGRTYAIFYRASGALRYFDDHDELYWNVTGTGWSVPIRRASVSVRMPPGADAAAARKACYTGPEGSTRGDCRMNVQGDRVEFAASEPLTVVVGWPPGIVAKLEAEKISRWLPFWPLILPVIVVGALYLYWRKHGRDPHRSPTLVVQYEAPEGVTPAEAGTLIDERADNKDVAATLVDLAVRGFVRLRETDRPGLFFGLGKIKDTDFDRLKDQQAEAGLRPYERRLLETVFGRTGTSARLSDLKNKYAFQYELPRMKKEMYSELVARGYFAADPERVRGAWAGVGILLCFLTVFGANTVANVLGTNLFATYAAGTVSSMLVAGLGFLMPRKTEAGADAEDHLRGYREYIDKAEKYRSQWQEKENIFEKTLPYAMAFGVVGKWTKAFEGVAMAKPDWYEGSAFQAGVFNAAVFNSAFDSFNSSFSSALTSQPSSSSGGSGFSGGHSGGGGGGGGGGSW